MIFQFEKVVCGTGVNIWRQTFVSVTLLPDPVRNELRRIFEDHFEFDLNDRIKTEPD